MTINSDGDVVVVVVLLVVVVFFVVICAFVRIVSVPFIPFIS